VSFLRRLLGGDPEPPSPPADPAPGMTAEDAEQRHERDLLRAESERLDELQQRQLRYADRAWTPPAQGGDRRADEEADQGEG
jgi:hypothetical protein